MGIIGLTLKFIKLDMKNSLIYLGSLTVEFFIVCSIFNLYFVPGIIPSNMDDKIILGSIFLVVAFVILLLGYSVNEYYVKRRGREIAVEMMSGASVMDISIGFTLQNMIFNGLALIIGGGLSFLTMPFILDELYKKTGELGTGFLITADGIFSTTCLLFIQILFISLINAGLSHRTEICDLIKMSGSKYKPKKLDNNKYLTVFLLIFSIVLYFVPLFYSLFGELSVENPFGGASVMAVLGGISIGIFVLSVVPKLIDLYEEKYRFKGIYNTISLRNLKRSIQNSGSIVLSFTLITTLITYSLDKFLKLKGFAFITTFGLGSLSVMVLVTWIYKIVVEANNRKKNFNQLLLIGYTKKEIRKSINIEMSIYIFLTLILPFTQMLFSFFLYKRAGLFDNSSLIILFGYLLILLIMGFLSLKVYKKIIINHIKGDR
ncbi:hypothetical protein [Clostridium chrysemydis]|uniref:hypothetical protein n=1 Tax=Clostridium chrysemydis TaxID=2665504 RepID=UPI003F2B4319